MDFTVGLRLRAQAEGTSAIRAMREEAAGLSAAMKEVRAAARSGGQVSASTVKELGGFAEFQKRFAEVQKELNSAAKPKGLLDDEQMFRGQIRRMDRMAKVRLAESVRVMKEEAANAARGEADQRREVQETLRFRQRMWAQQSREAAAEARAEAEAVERSEADKRRAAKATLQANMRYWAQRARAAQAAEAEEAAAMKRAARQQRELMWGSPLTAIAGVHGGGHHRGRGVMGELATAAEYTLTYGAINQVLGGLSAIARSPFALGRMTLGVAEQSRGVKDNAAALGVNPRTYQDLRFAFAGKGLGEERVQPMLQFMEKSTVGALRGIKSETVAFKALGMSMQQLKADSRDPMRLLTDIGDRLKAIRNPSKRTAIADMIFGRDGSKYLPLFKDGHLRRSAAEAEASGATMSDSALEAGERVSEQWRDLKLQMAGIRNETASAAFPIMSQLLGDASNWLQQNRSVISEIISKDMAELKRDLPYIEKGFTNIANAALEIGRDLAPAMRAMTQFSRSSTAKYMFSGQLVPGGVDLADSKNAKSSRDLISHNIEHNPMTLGGAGRDIWELVEAAARQGARLGGASSGHVTVTVQAMPGSAVTSIHTTGAVSASARRGEVMTGG